MPEEIRKQFTYLGENTEKYITFTVPIEKEVIRIGKNGEEGTKNISYILNFVDSERFMASSLSNFVNNLSEGNHKIKCKFGHGDKKCGVIYKYCDCFFEYTNFEDDLIEYKCFCCNKSYQQNFDEKLKERFFNTYKFSNNDNNMFVLLLQKCVYPYEYVDDWEKLKEASLPEKEDFYSHLNKEDNTDANYACAKRVCKDFRGI